MTWIVQNRRAWRAVILALAAVAFIGPWSYEALSVPAEFACPPLNFRLDGDYCGSPVSGPFVFLWIISGPIEMGRALALSELDRALKIFSMVLALILALLPAFITLILVIGRHRRSRFQLATWGLATIAIPYLAADFSQPHAAQWGIWLYFGLVIGALALELSAFVAGKHAHLDRQVSSR